MKVPSKHMDVYKFQRLKESMCKIKTYIFFLTQCKRRKIIPKFIDLNLKTKTKSNNVNKAIKTAKRQWLINEIKSQYARLAKIELEIYRSHREIAAKLSPLEFDSIDRRINNSCNWVKKKEIKAKKKKLSLLQPKKHDDLKKKQEI